MKLVSASIFGLFGKEETIELNFFDDVTILTGRNGAGKTTVLKLLWYIISGNIYLALSEINFKSVMIKTSEYKILLIKISPVICKGTFKCAEGEYEFEDKHDIDDDVEVDGRDLANQHVLKHGGSVFFPTFRRIEGGFTLQDKSNTFSRNAMTHGFRFEGRGKNEIESGLQTLSKQLTNKNHQFISSISTSDIQSLLLENYSELSQMVSIRQQAVYADIIRRIAESKAVSGQFNDANNLLGEINDTIEEIQLKSQETMLPFEALSALVKQVFKAQSIRISGHLSLGDAAKAINSDLLSAGEKQMLSFVSYNAFISDTVFFIDEPELSLHVDWQRQLFPILLGQKTSNQYIICTHSPFIYSKYPDNEIALNSDRGNTAEANE